VGVLDIDLVWIFVQRGIEAVVVAQTIWIGATIRHEVRQGRWSPMAVRLVTAATWALVLAEVAASVLRSQFLYTTTHAVFLAMFAVVVFAYQRIVAAIRARSDPRLRLLREVSRIYGELDPVGGVADGAQIDEDLAALDRWVTPDTFEFIQLARSRVLAAFDGGPRAASRETRWSVRMNEIAAVWTEPVRPNRLGRISNDVRRWLLDHEVWFALGGGSLLGASTFLGRSVIFFAVPLIVLGWLVIWGTSRVAWLALVGSAVGMVTGAAYAQWRLGGPVPPSLIATTAAINIVVLVVAWQLFRSAKGSSRTNLRLVAEMPTDAAPDRILDPHEVVKDPADR
jgi:hypothetical protein